MSPKIRDQGTINLREDAHLVGLRAPCVRVAACGRKRLDDGPADGPVDRGQPRSPSGVGAELQEEQNGVQVVALRG